MNSTFLTYTSDDGKTYQAAPITFYSEKSQVTKFGLLEPKLDEDLITVNLANDKIEFKKNMYDQYQANVQPVNIAHLQDRYVRMPTLATAYPEGDVIVQVKDCSWGGSNVTVTWPTLTSNKADLKPLRCSVKGKSQRYGPKQMMELLAKGKVKNVDLKHTWFATQRPDKPGQVTISHRFELLGANFE